MTEALWIVALIAGLLLVSWFWRPRVKPDGGVVLLLVAFALLGSWAAWFGLFAPDQEPPGFNLWKPTVLYWTLAGVMILAPLMGWDFPVKAIFGDYFALSSREWRWFNRILAGLYAFLGAINLYVAQTDSEGDWTGFKYSWMMNLLIIILFRLNFVWLQILAEVSIHLYKKGKTAWQHLARLL